MMPPHFALLFLRGFPTNFVLTSVQNGCQPNRRDKRLYQDARLGVVITAIPPGFNTLFTSKSERSVSKRCSIISKSNIKSKVSSLNGIPTSISLKMREKP